MFDPSIVPELRAMLGYCRPHGSPMEAAFIRRYIQPLGATRDEWGNWHLAVPNVDGSPSRTLWSCHTDTVHKTGAQQGVYCDPAGLLRLTRRSAKRSGCLGADDTVGVFLARRMALAGRPGYYVFHYGEEAGCLGSRTLADERGPWLRESFDHAIAFDRRGASDVITHQMGSRTASDTFAAAIADQLNAVAGLRYVACDGGAYTDTDSYADDIPECSNLSIGYDGNHSHRETVDTLHVDRLLAALLQLDATALPADRDPSVRERWAVVDRFDWDAYERRMAARTLTDSRSSVILAAFPDCRLYPSDYLDPAEDDDPTADRCLVCGATDDYRIDSQRYSPRASAFCALCGTDWSAR